MREEVDQEGDPTPNSCMGKTVLEIMQPMVSPLDQPDLDMAMKWGDKQANCMQRLEKQMQRMATYAFMQTMQDLEYQVCASMAVSKPKPKSKSAKGDVVYYDKQSFVRMQMVSAGSKQIDLGDFSLQMRNCSHSVTRLSPCP